MAPATVLLMLVTLLFWVGAEEDRWEKENHHIAPQRLDSENAGGINSDVLSLQTQNLGNTLPSASSSSSFDNRTQKSLGKTHKKNRRRKQKERRKKRLKLSKVIVSSIPPNTTPALNQKTEMETDNHRQGISELHSGKKNNKKKNKQRKQKKRKHKQRMRLQERERKRGLRNDEKIRNKKKKRRNKIVEKYISHLNKTTKSQVKRKTQRDERKNDVLLSNADGMNLQQLQLLNVSSGSQYVEPEKAVQTIVPEIPADTLKKTGNKNFSSEIEETNLHTVKDNVIPFVFHLPHNVKHDIVHTAVTNKEENVIADTMHADSITHYQMENTELISVTPKEVDGGIDYKIKQKAVVTQRNLLTALTEMNIKSRIKQINSFVSQQEENEKIDLYNNTLLTDTEGDISCLNKTFIPAPIITYSRIKYIRSNINSTETSLMAEYKCKFGYNLVNSSNNRLICRNRKWIGTIPKCLPGKAYNSTEKLCENERGGCDQMCVQTHEGVACSCFKGFTLYGSICRDVDECAFSNGGCEYKCQNLVGTFVCLCPMGFRLGDDSKSCIDLNECLLRNGHGPCQDQCHNEWGGYYCSCEGLIGTRLAADNHTCEDVDECAIGLAGCSHGCLNTLGSAFCLCPVGFMLGPDWKTCQDIDECELEYLQREPCEIGCINTVGSYHCQTTCLPGWKLTTNQEDKSCEDIDECALGVSGCSHMCKNTPGGFLCHCFDGYKLAPDNTTCIDTAMRDVCPPLQTPLHGYVECARSPTLQPEIRHTRVVNHAGAVCELRCPQGYHLEGEYRRICGRDRRWHGPNSGNCVTWPVPSIQCPKNITYHLDPGRSTAYIEFKKPTTNVDWDRNVESSPPWAKDLEADLPEGYWEVKFVASHPASQHTSTCTFSINVIKKTFHNFVP